MLAEPRMFLMDTVVPWVINTERYLGRLDSLVGRSCLSALGWPIVLFTPLVAFDAGGGQTAVDVIQYVVFRGLDRDAWYATSALAMTGAALSSTAILLGLTLHTVGLVSRDWTLTMWGCGTILVSLLTVILATHPVSAVSMFGTMSLPHFGWWLTLFYAAVTPRLVHRFTYGPTS